eukprot:scaffold23961_cov131-Isochrysis_galbana.AAC.1
MLALPVLDQVERLQGGDDVVGGDGGHHADLGHRHVAAVRAEGLEQHLSPVAPEGEQAQIGQRLLRRAYLALAHGELIGGVDQKLGVALPLVLRQDQDARDVVVLYAGLLLAEIAGDAMTSVGPYLTQHVEEEGVDVVVERLVVEEKLGDEA